MAWWQHPEDQDTPPVTVERLTEWYEQQGYKYGVDGDDERQYVVSGFGGFWRDYGDHPRWTAARARHVRRRHER